MGEEQVVHRRCDRCSTDYWYPTLFAYIECRCEQHDGDRDA